MQTELQIFEINARMNGVEKMAEYCAAQTDESVKLVQKLEITKLDEKQFRKQEQEI